MNNRIFLSIAIPTYNRANSLEKLLRNIISQISKLQDNIEICISNNGSTDNTDEVVINFFKKYPNLIKYNENKKNLGFDLNVLKVVDMAKGEFIWTFSDDDLIVEGGIEKIVKFIKENKSANIGGIAVKDISYRIDKKTGKRIKYHSSFSDSKGERYKGKGIIGIVQGDIPYRFLSALLFNNKLLKEIIKTRKDLLEKGINSYYFHSWLFLLLFLSNEDAEYHVLNEEIVLTLDAEPKYRFVMEDHFELTYRGNFKFFDNLFSIANNSNKDTKNIIKKKRRDSIFGILLTMALFKLFKLSNFNSYIRCIKLSFKYFSFFIATIMMFSLIMISITPSWLIKIMYKMYLRMRFGSKAESNWLETYTQFTYWNKSESNRRMIEWN